MLLNAHQTEGRVQLDHCQASHGRGQPPPAVAPSVCVPCVDERCQRSGERVGLRARATRFARKDSSTWFRIAVHQVCGSVETC